MLKPPLPSLITMIGRNAASDALALDLSSPRHNARKPATELAPPTSTPNSVRWIFGMASGSASTSFPDRADATTSGIGGAAITLAGLSGSINLPAAGSGGAMVDLDSSVVATGPTTGVGTASAEGAAAAGSRLAIAPVTVSRPCSSTVTRE